MTRREPETQGGQQSKQNPLGYLLGGYLPPQVPFGLDWLDYLVGMFRATALVLVIEHPPVWGFNLHAGRASARPVELGSESPAHYHQTNTATMSHNSPETEHRTPRHNTPASS